MPDPMTVYDPRHTTGISPVHSNVKHPLGYDPRRGRGQTMLHSSAAPGLSRRRTLIGLSIYLVVLIAALIAAIVFIYSIG